MSTETTDTGAHGDAPVGAPVGAQVDAHLGADCPSGPPADSYGGVVVPLLRSVPAAGEDLPDPIPAEVASEVLARCARHADELAALVEAAIAVEDTEHAAARAALTQAAAAGLDDGQDIDSISRTAALLLTRHQRRRQALTVLDTGLGELHATLDELAAGHDLAPELALSVPGRGDQ